MRPAEAGVAYPHLLIEIQDTGIGIPKEKLAKIFDSFSQADESTTRRFGGSGLGTTIAKQLAVLMGGSIGVDSVEGEGSRFWVRLPLLGETPPPPEPPAQRLSGLRALVVEVNPSQRRLLSAALEREGVDCRAVAQPEDLGATHTEAQPPNFLVIADHLRRLDLATVRARIAAIQGEDRPCLFLTCAARRPVGPPQTTNWLGKPTLTRDLIAAVEVLVGRAPESAPTAHRPTDLTAGAPDANQIRVLVAEDNAIAAKVITTFLSKMGYPVTRVEDGEQALGAALKGGYAIAIIDLRMPKLDGAEFARRYRSQAPDQPLPIVALTANASEDVKRACLEAGMDAFLAKPVSPQLLRETIGRLALRP